MRFEFRYPDDVRRSLRTLGLWKKPGSADDQMPADHGTVDAWGACAQYSPARKGRENRGLRKVTGKVFSALSSPIRREILWRVWQHELPAGAIAKYFEVSAPSISQHLAVLLDAGLVTKRIHKTFRYYRAVQSAVRGLDASVFDGGRKWEPPSDAAASRLATASTGIAVYATVRATCSAEDAFCGFTDPALYSHWMRAKVSIIDGQFRLDSGAGTHVRGTYDCVVPPSFIAMTWDHDRDATPPVPGRAQRAYLTIFREHRGCRVEIHQMVESTREADYMESTWRLVLGRFRSGIAAALRGRPATPGNRTREHRR